MARTKASVGAKVSSGKSNKARCSVAPQTSSPSTSGSDRAKGGGGGNPVCPRDTPKWQRAITTFFVKDRNGTDSKQPSDEDIQAAGSSKSRKRNIIDSDDEEEPPKNTELDESIHLEQLTGDTSHKIEEYYPKNGEKGKGGGKKTKGKENNQNDRNKKREREDDVEESDSKRVKV